MQDEMVEFFWNMKSPRILEMKPRIQTAKETNNRSVPLGLSNRPDFVKTYSQLHRQQKVKKSRADSGLTTCP